MALDRIAADLAGVTGAQSVRYTKAGAGRSDVLDVADLNLEAGLLHVLDPMLAAAAISGLRHDECRGSRAFRHCEKRERSKNCEKFATFHRFSPNVT